MTKILISLLLLLNISLLAKDKPKECTYYMYYTKVKYEKRRDIKSI